MNIKQLVARQCDWEGFRERPYKCSEGYWTVGYGSRRWHGMPVSKYYPSIVSKSDALVALKAHLLDSIGDAVRLYPWEQLTPTQKEVLVHMVYQMGARGMNLWKRMNAAIDIGDMEAWVAEMIDSVWYRKYPRVAEPCVEAIRNDRW